MSGAPFYAEAFSPMRGRCFRMVTRQAGAGPVHCPEPPAWQGSFRARGGCRYTVEACHGHRPPPAAEKAPEGASPGAQAG